MTRAVASSVPDRHQRHEEREEREEREGHRRRRPPCPFPPPCCLLPAAFVRWPVLPGSSAPGRQGGGDTASWRTRSPQTLFRRRTTRQVEARTVWRRPHAHRHSGTLAHWHSGTVARCHARRPDLLRCCAAHGDADMGDGRRTAAGRDCAREEQELRCASRPVPARSHLTNAVPALSPRTARSLQTQQDWH